MIKEGRSIARTALERLNYASTVNIIITNNTRHCLDARKEWVRGGEGVVRPVSISLHTCIIFSLVDQFIISDRYSPKLI